MTDFDEKYKKIKEERQKYVDAIISSSSNKKIVVAGPGTGKTYLFREILKNKNNSLTLTFINTLVEDLSLELCGLSEVKTLHSFARSSLTKSGEKIKIFPKLSNIIEEDAEILLAKKINFNYLFHNKEDKDGYLDFYERRRNYYDKYYGYSDIVLTIVKLFEEKKEKIPIYAQVLVDEFQDFNKLEVSLIDLLSEKSPILLVGDDDHALYDFKSASTEHIRKKHIDTNYNSFTLPFCSRCTRVIVEAVNDIVNSAATKGFLKDRVKKPYQYFEAKDKDEESALNPKIIYKQLFEAQIPWFIEQQIDEIAKEVKQNFSVLIISPTKIKSRLITDSLKSKGFKNIEAVREKDANKLTLLDGLKLLLEDEKGNLGWRIVLKFLLGKEDFKKLVEETNKEGRKSIFDIISGDQKKEAAGMLKVLRAIKNGKDINEKELDEFLKKIDLNPYEMVKDLLKNEIISASRGIGNAGVRKIPIKAVTIQGSKGLDADYVFITHFDNQYFINDKDKKKISDRDICNFLVSLTRARRKVFLLSSNTESKPTFLEWINDGRIENKG